ncbi:MAG: hypothetical protein ACI4IR_06615 [Eubacterium sp.]
MKKVSIRIIVAVVAFLLFGWVALIIGTDNWIDALSTGLLGAGVVLLIFRE